MSRAETAASTTRLLIWIPARGGSVRVPDKNIRPVADLSMVARALLHAHEFLRRAELQGRVVVDTDSEAIAEEALQWGGEVPFLREPRFAGSEASSVETGLRLLDRLRQLDGYSPSAVLVLQPTSPLREVEHTLECWRVFAQTKSDRVVSVRPADVEVAGAVRVQADGLLSRASIGGGPWHCPSGSVYITRRDALERDASFLGSDATIGVVTKGPSALDVDLPFEHELAAAFLRAGAFRTRAPSGVIASVRFGGPSRPGALAADMRRLADVGASAVSWEGATHSPSEIHALEDACEQAGLRLYVRGPGTEGAEVLRSPEQEVPEIRVVATPGEPLISLPIADGPVPAPLLFRAEDRSTFPELTASKLIQAAKARGGVAGWEDCGRGIEGALYAWALGVDFVVKEVEFGPVVDESSAVDVARIERLARLFQR